MRFLAMATIPLQNRLRSTSAFVSAETTQRRRGGTMFWRALTAASLIVIPGLAQAQTGADSVVIHVEATARWYASQVPANSRVGFVLPRGPRSGPAPTPGQIEAAQHGARVLRATLIPFDSLTRKLCDRKHTGDCGPGKFDLGVEVHVIRITGNASEVSVIQSTTGPGPRLRHGIRGWTILVVRSGDGWAFDQILSTSVS